MLDNAGQAWTDSDQPLFKSSAFGKRCQSTIWQTKICLEARPHEGVDLRWIRLCPRFASNALATMLLAIDLRCKSPSY